MSLSRSRASRVARLIGGAAPDAAGLILPCSQMTWGIMNTSIAALMPNTLKFTHTLSGKLRAT